MGWADTRIVSNFLIVIKKINVINVYCTYQNINVTDAFNLYFTLNNKIRCFLINKNQ